MRRRLATSTPTAARACGGSRSARRPCSQLPTWSLSGGAVAKVRQFINKVKREAPDLVVREYAGRRVPDPEIDDQLEDISSEWLATKKGGEMGFNLGVFRSRIWPTSAR